MTNAGATTPAGRRGGLRAPTKSDLTRERIVAAAAYVLAHRGYAGTKLSDIAARAGLRAGSLYYHFADRDALVDHVVQQGVAETERRVVAALDALPAGSDPLVRLQTAVRAHLEAILDIGDVSSAGLQLLRQLPPELQRRYRAAQRSYGLVWDEVIRAGQAAGAIRSDMDPVRLRLFVIGQLNWVAEWPVSARGRRAELLDEAVELVTHGVAPR